MAGKRLIVEMDPQDYVKIAEAARLKGLSVSNYVRRALDLPEQRQGVKGIVAEPPKKAKR